jgi:FkbM family methyltransferase
MNHELIRAFLGHINHYQAVLPYNLNWSTRPDRAAGEFLSSHPLVVVDVGSRGGLPSELARLERFIRYFAFDPDEKECERLARSRNGCRELRALPYFVGPAVGTVAFNLFRRRAESSALCPDERYRRLFGGDAFDVETSVEVRSTTLDALLAQGELELPDLLKLDTQGTELGILQSSPRALDAALLVETEVEFVSMYQGQPLFHDVQKFMVGRGFELLYLNRVFAQRAQIYRGPARGQVVFADALYGRREDRLEGFDAVRLAKYAMLLVNYGHLDLAFQIWRDVPDLRERFPRLGDRFRPMARYSPFELLKRGLLSQVDKIACLLLHLRRYNQLPWDSDRSWPVR